MVFRSIDIERVRKTNCQLDGKKKKGEEKKNEIENKVNCVFLLLAKAEFLFGGFCKRRRTSYGVELS